MSDDNIKQFPNRMLGMRAHAATLDSELDPGNPFTDSLRQLLEERRSLIETYTSGDGSVREIERKIAERLEHLAGIERKT